MFCSKTSAVLFSLGFFFAYAIIDFHSEFVVFLLRSPSLAFARCIHSEPFPSILYVLFVLFFFTLYNVFSRIFSLATGFLFSGIFAALPITSRALLAFCLQSSFASQTMCLCRAFLATLSLSFLLFGLVVFKGILFCQLCRIF